MIDDENYIAETPHKLYQHLSKNNIRRAFDGEVRHDLPYNVGRDVEDHAAACGYEVIFILREKKDA